MDTPTDQERWSVAHEDDTRQGFWYLSDDRRWDDKFVAKGLEKDELEYAAMLLNAGELDDEGYSLDEFEELILDLVARVFCERCDQPKFRREVDDSGRCAGCAS